MLNMIMLINLEGTLTQTRIGVSRVTFPSNRSMRGLYGVLMAKFRSCYTFFYFQLSFLETKLLFY